MIDVSYICQENLLSGYAEPITMECLEKIIKQMKKCICKIRLEKESATGFFCNILYDNKPFPVLITNHHVINREQINNISILQVSLNDDTENKNIKINEKRKIYTSEKYDTTIIEIKEEDEINNFLELDDDILKDYQSLINENIYIIQYPDGNHGKQKASVSIGVIKSESNFGGDINNKYLIIHLCSTKPGSSGSPILRTSNNKIIGIHRGGYKENFNIGNYLRYPIKEYFAEQNIVKKIKEIKNEIYITLKIEKNDINQEIYFFDNTDGTYDINEKEVKSVHDNLKELNESKPELYINSKKTEYKKCFKPTEEGNFLIRLKFNNIIKDCSFMFYDCSNITTIDLSSFDTKNVTNMSYMFSGCDNITNLDLSSFDTKNVTNMSNMFCDCNNIINLNLSSFDTEKVTNMSNMFSGCEKITNIDLSSFNTKNVTNMSNMFYNCRNIKNLDLSKFDTENVTNMNEMFYYCNNIKELNLSKFITKNVTNMSNMFYWCKNLQNLNISTFDTGKTVNMSNMFSGCKSLTNLNISSFDTKKDTNISDMFNNCNITTIKIKKTSNEKFIEQIPHKTTIVKK